MMVIQQSRHCSTQICFSSLQSSAMYHAIKSFVNIPKSFFFSIFVSFLYLQHLHSGSFRHKLKVCIHTFTHSAFTDTFLFQQFILLTLTTSSSVERHLTASETSITEASIPTVTTFTGTATVLPVSTAVFKISESQRQKERAISTAPVEGLERSLIHLIAVDQ